MKHAVILIAGLLATGIAARLADRYGWLQLDADAEPTRPGR